MLLNPRLTASCVESMEQVAQGGGQPLAPAAVAAEYLRDRVGVPRDMAFPAARQLRAHLNFFLDAAHGEPTSA